MRKVIVIDDETIQRRGLVSKTPWKSCGCEVVGEADNVQDALILVRRAKPHIIVTDIKMPGLSGLDLIEMLREEWSGECIIISGYEDFSYAKHALKLGVRHYLLKPVDDNEFVDALRDVATRLDEQEAMRKIELELENRNISPSDSLYRNYGNSKQDKYLEKAVVYIAENCDKNLLVQDVADYLHISASYFWKLFSRRMSCTFNDYLTECRIRKAIRFLDDENMKVYEIAAACGYKDTRYFSGIFKKIVGITPTEYRDGKTL